MGNNSIDYIDSTLKAKQTITIQKPLTEDYKNWRRGDYEGDGKVHPYKFEIHNENCTFTANNINGNKYEVYADSRNYLKSAKIKNDDGTYMQIDSEQYSVHTPNTMKYNVDFESDGEYDYGYRVSYTDTGKIAYEEEFTDGDDKADSTCYYTYDQNTGNLTSTDIHIRNNDGSFSDIKNEYYQDDPYTPTIGKTVYECYDENGKKMFRTSEVYDQKGRLLQKTYSEPKPKGLFSLFKPNNDYTKTYSYDDEGRVTKEVSTGKGQNYTKEYLYKDGCINYYDSKGRLTKTESLTEETVRT